MRFPVLIAAGLLAASTALYAQAPKPDEKGGRRPARFDCSQAKDPKACEAEAAKRREAHAKARKACDGKQGAERGECMRRETCAQSANPAQCEARAKEAMARRDKARAACQGKAGDEYRACMREQHRSQHGAKKQ